MKRIRTGISSLLLVTSVLFSSCANEATKKPDPTAENWISLFNGKDLAGWDVKLTGHELGDNYRETFRVTDGVIDVNYDAYDLFDGRFGVLVYRQPFSYYRLAVDYRFTGEQLADGPGWAFRNSGLMLHSQSAASMLKDQDFPISIEAQLLGGNSTDDRTTLNLCTPGTNVVMDGELVTRHCVNSSSATYHGNGWVTVEIEVRGSNAFIHRIDGQVVLQYESPQAGGGNVSNADTTLYQDGQLLESGFIGLQSESHPVQFRNVKLLDLKGCMDPESPHYKSYFVEDSPADCMP